MVKLFRHTLMKYISHTLIAVVLLVFSSCKSDDESSLTPTGEIKTYHFSGEINGSEERKVFLDNAYFLSYNGDCEQNGQEKWFDFEVRLYQDGFLDIDEISKEEILLEFRDYFHNPGGQNDMELFHSVFQTGKHSFHEGTGSNPGVIVSWIDENEQTWSTQNGPQVGSSFDVTYSTDTTSADGTALHAVRAKVDCTLYNNNGNGIEVTGGSLFLPLRNVCN